MTQSHPCGAEGSAGAQTSPTGSGPGRQDDLPEGLRYPITMHQALHILRNPWGWSDEQQRAVRLWAATELEQRVSTAPDDLSQFDGHTGLPWTAFYKEKYSEWHVSVAPWGASAMKQALFPDGVPTDRAEVDARLIAAAPSLLAELRAARATIAQLESAIRWALGYDEGEPHFGDGEQAEKRYGWRTELRRRAAIPVSTPTAIPADGDGGAPTPTKLK